MGINNPIPRNLKNETKKAAKILASFVKPNQILGADQVIPPRILKNAKGLAVVTVLKAGFLFSGRAGSGVIVARLPDGSWSGPSAITMAGAGAGGLIGAELTDFVFILNTPDAVKSFSEFGTFTLGGNVSVAAGPLGRNAEASASASMGGVAAVFSYSKTKGLFAGISVEGSVIMERREANRKFYGDNCTSKLILTGKVRPPPAAEPLLRVLSSRAFNNVPPPSDNIDDFYDEDDSAFYNDIPDSFDTDDGYSRRNSSHRGFRDRSSSYRDEDDYDDDYSNDARAYYSSRRQASRSRWEDDVYDRGQSRGGRRGSTHDVDDLSNRFSRTRLSPSASAANTENSYGRGPRLGTGPQISSAPKVVALYSFPGEEEGDLPFRKGDVITVLKKTDSQNDWWTGRVNGREGMFPANYVELV